jgi:hypothetical protein
LLPIEKYIENGSFIYTSDERKCWFSGNEKTVLAFQMIKVKNLFLKIRKSKSRAFLAQFLSHHTFFATMERLFFRFGTLKLNYRPSVAPFSASTAKILNKDPLVTSN